MSNTTHTPGPWFIEGRLENANIGYRAIIDGEGFTVCNPSPMGEANALLIAAAPDLLAELEAIAEILSQGQALDKDFDLPRITAAIAKANAG